MPNRHTENWFALMCEGLTSGSISEERFVEDASAMGIDAERIEGFIDGLKRRDGVDGLACEQKGV
jgi:hypothetical protein